ncbi:MAG: hypothetical protein ACM37W_04550 [Actinomycetota bacterium]
MINFYIPDRLPPREAIADKFTKPLVLTGDDRRLQAQWTPDRELLRHLTICQKDDPQFRNFYQQEQEEFLVFYFWKNLPLQSQPEASKLAENPLLPCKHLLAYFDAACYQAAKARYFAWRNLQDPRETFEKYWEIGKYILKEKIPEILNKYQVESEIPLNSYVQKVLAYKIRDEFYRQTGQGKRSIWGSLKETSKKNLRLALEKFGIEQKEILCCLFARDRFFEVCQPIGEGTKRKFQQPTSKDFAETAELYNLKRVQSPHPEVASQPVSASQVQKWLNNAILALQHFSQPVFVSLDAPSYEDSCQPPLSLEAQAIDSALTYDPEWQQQLEEERNHLKSLLNQVLCQMKGEDFLNYQILIICYGLDLGQSSTEELLKLNNIAITQSNISRRLKNVHLKIPIKILENFNRDFNISLPEGADEQQLDRQIQAWATEKQKQIKAGLIDYLQEWIFQENHPTIHQKLAESSQIEDRKAIWRDCLNQWARQTLKISLEPGALSPKLEKSLNELIENLIPQ